MHVCNRLIVKSSYMFGPLSSDKVVPVIGIRILKMVKNVTNIKAAETYIKEKILFGKHCVFLLCILLHLNKIVCCTSTYVKIIFHNYL